MRLCNSIIVIYLICTKNNFIRIKTITPRLVFFFHFRIIKKKKKFTDIEKILIFSTTLTSTEFGTLLNKHLKGNMANVMFSGNVIN